ncbi:MAG: methyltransferase, TIGR04325 family [Pseudomonadota bacterium]
MRLRQILKNKARQAIDLLPWGEDVRLYFNPAAEGIAYRGVFTSFDDALSQVRADRSSDYDASYNANVATRVRSGQVDITAWLHDHDYPMLFWLARAIEGDSRVVDFGGSLGHLFYSVRTLFPLDPGVRWTVVELETAVAQGRAFAEDMAETRLEFMVSEASSAWPDCDVFVSAGTIQYVRQSAESVIAPLPSRPAHVILHTLPVHEDRTFWTLQRIGATELPYRIQSAASLIEAFSAQGYELVSRWMQAREVRIPFRSSWRAQGYGGFYFRRTETPD